MQEKFYNANLGFILDYGDGIKKDEMEYEILKVAFQTKGSSHYARGEGGSFEDLEQEKYSTFVFMSYIANIIESVYKCNEKKNFEPYIVVGSNDFSTNFDENIRYSNYVEGKAYFEIFYTLFQDLSVQGQVKYSL